MLEHFLTPGAVFRRRAAALTGLLEAERALIRAGDVAGLAALGPRRDKLVAALEAAEPVPGPESEVALEALRRAAARNMRLLEAFRDGLARAGEEARRVAGAGRSIGLYGPTGGRLAEPAAAPQRDRRA